MVATIFERPHPDPVRQAEAILRARHAPGQGGYTREQIDWAVGKVRECDPDHPFLRYSERDRSLFQTGQQ